jgi:hypothetical protein
VCRAFNKKMNTQQGVRVGYISCVIGNPADDLHMTIVRRYDACDEDLILMQLDVERFKVSLPFSIKWGNFCQMGEVGTIPAYRVYFTHALWPVHLHDQYYKEAPGKAIWRKPKFHVTVDTPAKRAALEAMIRASADYRITDMSFKTRVEGGQQEVNGDTWTCASCGCRTNPIGRKTCSEPNCDQWRPIAAVERPGDWYCPCGKLNFAFRNLCMGCGQNNAPSAPSIPQFFEPPFAAAAAAPVQAPPKRGRRPRLALPKMWRHDIWQQRHVSPMQNS